MAATYDFITGSTFTGQSSRTFSSIPQTYTDLVLQCHINMSGGNDLYIRFNGNASNYYMLGASTNNVGGFRSYAQGMSELRPVGWINTPQQGDNPCFVEVVIPEYANSSYTKNGNWNMAYIANTSTNVTNVGFGSWQWRNTAAITQIEFLTNGNTFSGQISIYGITAGNA